MFYHGIIGMIATAVYIGIETIIKKGFREYSWEVWGLLIVSAILDTGGTKTGTMAY